MTTWNSLQRAVDVAVDQEEISRFPCHIRSGGFGLQCPLKCCPLPVNVARDLIRGCEIEPVVRVVWIQANGRLKGLDRGLRISGRECIVASQSVPVIRIAR